MTRLIGALLALGVAQAGLAEPTLERVRAAGMLHCGVVIAPEDWNKVDLHGDLSALDVEVCKAVGVAALGEQVKVDLTPFDSEMQAEQGLESRRVDLVVGVTPRASAAAQWHVAFGPAVFYDGLALLVHDGVAGERVADLAGRTVCVIDATENDAALQDLSVAHGAGFKVAPWQEEGEMDDAMATHWCDAVGAYVSRLVPLRNEYPQLARTHLLPQLLSVVPIAPAYRDDDRQWGLIVDSTVQALVAAEELGLDHETVRAQAGRSDPSVAHLVGTDWSLARALGLLPAKDWAVEVVAVVGNYGEIYARTVGEGSEWKLPRGPNALWRDGGLLHAPPLR